MEEKKKASGFIKNNVGIFIKLCFIAFFIILIIVFAILKTNPTICENWTRSFSNFYISTFGHVAKVIPFSLTEWIVFAIIILAITFLVLMIIDFVKKRGKKGIHKLLNIGLMLSSVFAIYFVTTELAYNREDLPIALYNEKVEKEKFNEIASYFVNDFNNCAEQLELDENGEIVNFYSLDELNKIAEQEYSRFDDNDYFIKFTTRGKSLLLSSLFSELNLTGITIGPLVESSLNTSMPNLEKPFTLLHELAHAKGVMREEDAQLVAAYLSLTSNDFLFRYSGYVFTISSLLTILNYTGNKNDYKNMVNTLSNKYRTNILHNSKFWQEHKSLKTIARFFNDLYLMFSGESKGTESYDDTPTEVDPETREITSFSTYQKLYFEIYFNFYNLK